MKSKIIQNIFLIALSVFLFSCGSDSDDTPTLKGGQSPIGEVGNSFTMSSINGVSNPTATVTKLENGVSTVACAGSITNNTLLEILKAVDADLVPGTLTISGSNVQANLNIKFNPTQSKQQHN